MREMCAWGALVRLVMFGLWRVGDVQCEEHLAERGLNVR